MARLDEIKERCKEAQKDMASIYAPNVHGALHDDIPYLLAEVERGRKENAIMKKALERIAANDNIMQGPFYVLAQEALAKLREEEEG